MKKFNTKDGMGSKLIQEKGIKVGIITGENNNSVKKRAEKLNLDFLYMGITDKLKVLDEICSRMSLNYDEVAYLGDDINDFEVLKRVKYSFAVNDAHAKIKKISRYITDKKENVNPSSVVLRTIKEIIKVIKIISNFEIELL